jgi:hypothetical protein
VTVPLPDAKQAKQPWPPPAWKQVFATFETCSTWYAGDPNELAQLYGGFTSAGTVVNRPAQFSGGIVGAAARMWWGQPVPPGEQRAKLHIPLAGDIASKSADLLYSEPPTFEFEKNPDASKRVEGLIDDGLYTTLIEAAEVAAALGGAYLRIVWDSVFRPLPWIDLVHADSAVPEFQWGQLRAVTFWDVLERDEEGTVVVRHLERHEFGRIEHAVYRGTDAELGHQVRLTDYEATAGYAHIDPATGVVMDDRVGIVLTGVEDALTAEYIPNIGPNRQWRKHPQARFLGRPDYSPGVIGLFDGLDEIWSSWFRDIRLGKSRLIVPEQYLRNLGIGQGAHWSAEQEIFTALKMLSNKDGAPQITESQFDIRVEEHDRSSRRTAEAAVQFAGYSAQSFGFTSDTVAITATETNAKLRASNTIRDKKSLYQRSPVARIVETLLKVDATLFGSTVAPARPKVKFSDGVSESPEVLARTIQLLDAAGAISTYMKVKTANPGWTEPEVMEEVKRITDEKKALQNPDSFVGGPFDRTAPGADDEPADGEDEDAAGPGAEEDETE